jgi:SAM-dependent methyltransferase
VRDARPELAAHPDRQRWNARYASGGLPSFTAHPLMTQALSHPLPEGDVLDLACGPSGSTLLAAACGRHVTAVDVSDAALGLLAAEARRRGLLELISLVHADLMSWRPPAGRWAVVLCTGYWDRDLFPAAASAVAEAGLLGWEALTTEARRAQPHIPAQWCVGAGEPACMLPGAFEILSQHDLPNGRPGTKRRLLARRAATPSRHQSLGN